VLLYFFFTLTRYPYNKFIFTLFFFLVKKGKKIKPDQI
jgi:hypothetical protein